MKKLSITDKYGLALEGGGAKGSYEIGAYLALKKLGFKFDMVAGTSIGALNAALIVQKDMKLAKELWLNADSELIGISNDLVKLYKNFKLNKENILLASSELKKIIKNKGLDINKYSSIVRQYINESKVRNSNIDYGLVTVKAKNFEPLELTIKDIKEGKLHEYIVASSYLPVFKMNKIIDDSYYLDGGLTNNLPISLLKKNNCNKIIAIKVDGIGRIKKNDLKDVDIIKPTKNTGPIVLFDNNDIKNNYYMGYYDTLLYYNKLIGYKYYFKKFRFFKLLTRKIDNKIFTLLKLKYKTYSEKEATIKAIEEVLEDNNIYYYKVYSIIKVIKYIKHNNLKSKNKLVNEFIEKI